MATRLGEASAPSAGGRRTKKKNKSKFRKTGLWLRGMSLLHRCPLSVHLPDVTAVIHVSGCRERKRKRMPADSKRPNHSRVQHASASLRKEKVKKNPAKSIQ